MPLNIDIQQILLHMFNFIILFAGLYFLLYKPVKNFMEQREAKYRKMDEDARKSLENAKESEAEYAKKLSAADQEIAEKKKAADAELEKYRAQREKEAKDEAAKIITDAKAVGASMRDNIVNGAQKEITEMVERAAEKILVGDSVSDTFDAFLDQAERSVKDGTEQDS